MFEKFPLFSLGVCYNSHRLNARNRREARLFVTDKFGVRLLNTHE